MRVLIADDQRSFGTALADMVRWCGHDVIAVVGSGLEAIHGYTTHKPDLVLMDYRMPKLNGGTACRHILAKNPTARIILVSAWSPQDGADQSGAMCFLPKPVELDRLNITLHNISQTLPSSAPANSNSSLPAPSSALVAEISDLPAVAEPATINYEPQEIDYFPEPSPFIPAPPPPLEMIFPADTAPLDIFPQTEEVFAPVIVDLAPQRSGRKQRRRAQHARPR
jgi:two-component system chemotaxis response regulator CheY